MRCCQVVVFFWEATFLGPMAWLATVAALVYVTSQQIMHKLACGRTDYNNKMALPTIEINTLLIIARRLVGG